MTIDVRNRTVQASFDCPRGVMITKPWGVQLHPSDWMIHRNRGRVPLFTRHCLGVAEAERDQRRRQPVTVMRCEPPVPPTEDELKERATCSGCLARTYRGEECLCDDGGDADELAAAVLG